MDISSEINTSITTNTLVLPRAWDVTLARWVSDLLSPPLLAIAGILLAAWQLHSASAWLWAIYFILLTVALPVCYVLWKVRRGEITDFHIYRCEQRIKPMLLTLGCSITAGLSLWAGQAPLTLILFAAMGILQVGFLLLVTLRWKISGHGTAIASLTVFLIGLYGSLAAPILLAIPLVAWARVRLNRHDLAQTSAGALVGAVFMGTLLYLISLSCQGAEIICR